MATVEEIVAKAMAGKNPDNNGQYIKAGKARLIVKELRMKSTRKNGLGFVAEFQVQSSSDTEAVPMDKPGSSVCWMQLCKWDNFGGNLVGFLSALTGDPISEFNVEANLLKHLGKLIGPDQPLRGALVDYEGHTIITAEKKIPITKAAFSTVEQGDLKAQREALGPYIYIAYAV